MFICFRCLKFWPLEVILINYLWVLPSPSTTRTKRFSLSIWQHSVWTNQQKIIVSFILYFKWILTYFVLVPILNLFFTLYHKELIFTRASNRKIYVRISTHNDELKFLKRFEKILGSFKIRIINKIHRV
jgi:hypothetical protein